MVYHIVNSYSVYSTDLYRFMDKNKEAFTFNQVFVSYSKKQIHSSSLPVKYKTSFLSFLFFFLFLKKNDIVIFHSYSHPFQYIIPVIIFWNLKKIIWLIWGGDLYYYANTKNMPFKYKIYALFRNHSVKHFKYISGANEDYKLAKSFYNIKGNKFIKLKYPLDWEADKLFHSKAASSTTKILLGNSADPSNNHEEALNSLVKYKDNNIEIYMPLNYGGDSNYINKIIDLGYLLFANKFFPIVSPIKKANYIKFLSTMDILVFFHDRQQGLGNIRIMLMLGKKIYIKPNNASNDYLTRLGITYYNTDSIKNINFIKFISYSELIAQGNLISLKKEFSDSSIIKYWRNITL